MGQVIDHAGYKSELESNRLKILCLRFVNVPNQKEKLRAVSIHRRATSLADLLDRALRPQNDGALTRDLYGYL